ncbi:hypothetical protein BDF19DRAFT_466320 [Syncephalis fuscata]|nr:hypothetical protein BDF19DRAFT_466320 [Syncephalis fuscata]
MPSPQTASISGGLRHAVHPAALLSGLGVYIQSLPLLCISIAIWMTLIYVADTFAVRVLSWEAAASKLGLWPNHILQWEVYRLVTFPWIHLRLGHLLLNLLGLVPLLSLLESAVGTLQTAYLLIVTFSILPGLGYVALSVGDSALSDTIVAGSSGWIFALIVWEAKRYGSRSFFGLFTVPSQLFPIFMLLVVTILFPNASFWGHFTGMLAGYLYAYGLLRYVIPRAYHFERLENLSWLQSLTRMRRYVKAETDGLAWLPVHSGDVDPATANENRYLSNPFAASSPNNNNNNASSSEANKFPGQGVRLGQPSSSNQQGTVVLQPQLLLNSNTKIMN